MSWHSDRRRLAISAAMLLTASPVVGQSLESDPASMADVTSVEVDAGIKDEADAHKSEARLEIARLRRERDARGPTTGRVWVDRTPKQQADAARLAIADLDEVLVAAGYKHENSITSAPVADDRKILTDADEADRSTLGCENVVRRDDPNKALAEEARLVASGKQSQIAYVLGCKSFLKGFIRGVMVGGQR